jgi:lipoprotein-releasing system permease protein
VKLPFSLFLALRYLKPRGTFVSVITLLSLAGVALGTWLLVVVISVMTGFDMELRRKVLGFDAHVLVTSDQVVRDWRPLDDQIQKQPHVIATAPFVQGPVIVEFNNQRLAPKIRGIDPEREQRVTDIKSAIKEGAFDLSADENGDSNKVLMGRELANGLGVGVGDKVIVYSPGNISAIVDELNKADAEAKAGRPPKSLQDLRQMVLPAELTVTGIFESGRFVYDAEFLLVPLHVGQELYGLGDDLHGITVRTDDPYKAPDVKRELLKVVPPDLNVLTWIDMNAQLFDAIRLERNVMFVLLLSIFVVAAFGIMSSLITKTVQKTREIGVLKALGASPWQIVWVFLTQAVIVGVIGNLIGLVMGLLAIRFRNEFKEFLAHALHIEIFPAAIYQFTELPAEVVPKDVALICVSAIILSTLAALVPAIVAARLDPVKALRYE